MAILLSLRALSMCYCASQRPTGSVSTEVTRGGDEQKEHSLKGHCETQRPETRRAAPRNGTPAGGLHPEAPGKWVLQQSTRTRRTAQTQAQSTRRPSWHRPLQMRLPVPASQTPKPGGIWGWQVPRHVPTPSRCMCLHTGREGARKSLSAWPPMTHSEENSPDVNWEEVQMLGSPKRQPAPMMVSC